MRALLLLLFLPTSAHAFGGSIFGVNPPSANGISLAPSTITANTAYFGSPPTVDTITSNGSMTFDPNAILTVSTVQVLQNGVGGNGGMFPNVPVYMSGNANGALQSVIYNRSNGVNASSEYTGSTDLGGNTSYYFTIGINGSKYAQSGFSVEPASASFYQTGDSPIYIWSDTNGGLNGAATGYVIIGSSNESAGNMSAMFTPSSTTIFGLMRIQNAVTVSSNVIGNSSFTTTGGFFGNGSGLTGVTVSNLSGGAIGNVPYQSGVGVTAFLPTMASGGLIVGSGAGNIPSTGTVAGSGGIIVTVLANSSLVVSTGSSLIAVTNAPNTFTSSNTTTSTSRFTGNIEIASATLIMNGSGISATIPLLAGSPVTITSSATILGVTDGSNVQAGFVGEFISTTPTGAANFPTSGNYASISTTSFQAGDWQVTGQCVIVGGATYASSQQYCCISTTPNGADNQAYCSQLSFTAVANDSTYLTPPMRRINASSAQTVYLTAGAVYSVLGGSTMGSGSHMEERRMR